ncbi:MAG: dUTP diphosphatase [Candidatus Cloacimonetes bacterium]|nr:dUTP diphosphatase [Candidatus Cloacimonadota bacterium]MDD5624133.1 dUTP diphosphatase [Candidatus Cloacimonadota bacterium]
MNIRYKRLKSDAVPPQKMSSSSSGWDLCATISEPIILAPGARAAIPTGLALEIPPGYEGQIRPRSGLALDIGLGILNSPGTIDADYRGEVKVILINLSSEAITINPLMRIAQLVICPVINDVCFQESEQLNESLRADGGFGHTGY